MSLTVYVGDINTVFNDPPLLVHAKNFSQIKEGTVFTSLADIGSVENLYHLLAKANDIFYCPPDIWSDGKTASDAYSAAWITENYMRLFGVIPVDSNFELLNKRTSDQPHLFVAGCSTTNGFSIEYDKKFSYIISKSLDIPLVDLSYPGSSNEFAAYQLLHSDIRSCDIVIWGMTTKNRYMKLDKTIQHINSSTTNREYTQEFDTENLLEKNVLNVFAVNNFLSKVGCKFVIANIHTDIDITSRIAHLPNFCMIHGTKGLDWNSNFLDYGNDNKHPGPKTHKMYAETILKRLT